MTMGNPIPQYLTLPFLSKELPADRAAIEARILLLERQVFILGRWLFVLGARFLLPEGRFPWLIYLGYAILCAGYTISLFTSGRPGRRVALAQWISALDYGFVVYLIAGAGGVESPLQLLLPVLFFRNQLLLHGLAWARWDGLFAATAWLIAVKLGSPWSEIISQPLSWAFMMVLGACAGLGALMISLPAAPARASGRDGAVSAREPGRAMISGARARLAEEAPDWIFLLDSSGRFLYLNRQFESLFPGLKRDQQIGHRLQEMVWPPDAELAEELIASALIHEKHPGEEVRFSQANGSVSQLRLHLKQLALTKSGMALLGVAQEVEFGPKGGPGEQASSAAEKARPEELREDLLEQESQVQQLVRELQLAEEQVARLTKEAEEAKDDLERELAQTDLILSTLSTALLQIGPDFRLRGLRGPAREWFALSDRNLGMPCASALWQNEAGPCSGCRPPASSGEPAWEECASASGKKYRRLRLPKAGNGGTEGGWLEMIQPQPESKPCAERRPAEPPKPDALALAGRVAGTVAHEFNNIFSAIQGFALLAEEDQSYVNDFVQTVKEQSKRGEQLNQALLHLVRGCTSSEQGGDLKEILEELILLVERELTKMNLRLRPLLVDTPRVQANPGALRRLLFELLFRLAETMPRSSELIIQTRFDAQAAEVLLGSAPAPFSPERLEEIIGRTLAEVPSLCGQGQGFELRANDEALSGPQLLIRLALAPTPQTRDSVAAEEQT